jgi:hypothetical protein
MSIEREMRQMLFLVLSLQLTLLLGDDATGQDGRTSKKSPESGVAIDGQAISISTLKAAYSPEEHVVLQISYKNVGKIPLRTYYMLFPFWNYHINITGPDGTKVGLTRFGSQLLEVKGGSAVIRTLKPGEEVLMTIPLSRCYDLSLNGKYCISVTKLFVPDSERKKTFTLTSNKTEITIDEKLSNSEYGLIGANGGGD